MENEGNVRNDSALSGQKEMEELFSGEHSKEATVRFYRKHAKNYDKVGLFIKQILFYFVIFCTTPVSDGGFVCTFMSTYKLFRTQFI